MTDLDEIKRALAAATPGPWCPTTVYLEKREPPVACGTGPVHPFDGPSLAADADARLIARAPAWLTELVARAERAETAAQHAGTVALHHKARAEAAEAEVERLRGLVAELAAWLEDAADIIRDDCPGAEEGDDENARELIARARAALGDHCPPAETPHPARGTQTGEESGEG